MNMFEEARALSGMLTMCSLTQSEIAKKMGVSQSYVANKVRLLNFSEEVQQEILQAQLTERHARVLLKLKDDALIREAIEKIKAMRLSVAQTEALVDNMTVFNMAKNLGGLSAHESICAFEDIIAESIKNLAVCGVKVEKSRDFYKNKMFLTLSIEK